MNEFDTAICAAITDATSRRDRLNELIESLKNVLFLMGESKVYEPPAPIPAERTSNFVVFDRGRGLESPRDRDAQETLPKRAFGSGQVIRRKSGLLYARYLDVDKKPREISCKTKDYDEAARQLDAKIIERDKERAARATEKFLAKDKPPVVTIPASGFKPGDTANMGIVLEPEPPAAEPKKLARAKIATADDPKCRRGGCVHTKSQHTKPGVSGNVYCLGCWCYGFVGDPEKAVSA